MKYAIIGSGKIGTALARVFARKNIEVAVANSRGPETLASLAKELGPGILAKSVQDAHNAEIIFLAVPFSAHKDIAKQFKDWNDKILVDVTNAFHAAPEELRGRLSSEIVTEAFTGARVVKAFNHLPAQQLGTNPTVEGQRQVVFVSSNDGDASATITALASQLGFAPIELGRLDKGGTPLHVVGGKPGGLLLQNLVKIDDCRWRHALSEVLAWQRCSTCVTPRRCPCGMFRSCASETLFAKTQEGDCAKSN
jgi:predicted dinucleotide-binding enzyme